MKILLISHKHPPSLGGMETQSFFIATGLKTKHEVIEIIHKGKESRLTYFRKLKSRVKAILKTNSDIDLIHLNDGLMAFILHWLPSFTTVPIVVTFHGLDLIFPSSFYQSRLKKFTVNNCYAICVSQSTYNEAIKRGFKSQSMTYIDNGVNHEFKNEIKPETISSLSNKYNLNIDKEDILLVSIGRAVPRKGFSWFISHVMPGLPNNYKYLIVGPNNVSPTLKFILSIIPSKLSIFISTLMGFTTDYHVAQQSIIDNNLQNQVYFLNGVPFADLVNILSSSSLMIMPNIPFHGDMEGFGLVVLEANICEKYVAASDIEGITSAIHQNENGELISPQNAYAWHERINVLTSDLKLLDSKGQKAANYVKNNFGWDKMVNEYEAYFKTIYSKSRVTL